MARTQLRKSEKVFANGGVLGSSAGLHRFQCDAFAAVATHRRGVDRVAAQKNRGCGPEGACKAATWEENPRKPPQLTTNMKPTGKS